MIDLSIVIPLYNEEESLPELKAWIDRVLEGRSYEVIFVDDGSRDDSWKTSQLSQADPARVVGIRMARNYGKSAGLQLGLKRHKAALSLPWMPICKTRPRKFWNWNAKSSRTDLTS